MSASRLPLRARVTLAFLAACALVLLALALFLHARMRDQLDDQMRAGLRQRAGDLAAVTRAGGAAGIGRGAIAERGDDVAQVLDASGRVVAGAPGFERDPLLTAGQRKRAARGPAYSVHAPVSDDGPIQLLAAPAGPRTVVVGAFLQQRDAALRSLDRVLLTGIPAALLLAGLAGFVVAGAALRPIERVRRRAAAVEAADLSARVPVPEARDEVRRLAETLNGLLARLEEAFARERTFVADAGHELRTPLTRLKAELELAGRPGRRPAELEEAVRSAAEETDRLARLADDLLVLARADQGALPLRRTRVDVRELLAAVQRRLAPDATVDAPPGLVVEADRLRLEQALGNLADNARRHGGGAVALTAERRPDAVVLHVRDGGRGVAADVRPHAFERFTRGDPARGDDGGAGLGLAIVAAVAAAHGGRVGISDVAGGGADVWFELPDGESC